VVELDSWDDIVAEFIHAMGMESLFRAGEIWSRRIQCAMRSLPGCWHRSGTASVASGARVCGAAGFRTQAAKNWLLQASGLSRKARNSGYTFRFSGIAGGAGKMLV